MNAAPYNVLAILASTALLSACSSDAPPSYQADIRPLLEQHCVSCHQQGGISPFPLQSWDEVEPVRAYIVDAVEKGSMPPWGMDNDCRDVQYSLQLSDEQKALFTSWRAAEFPAGDEEDYIEPSPLPKPPDIGPPDLVLTPQGYTPNLDLSDDYRCIPLDHEFATDTLIATSDIYPDRLDVVHHVIVYVATADQRGSVQALDDSEEGPGFTCFGDSGIEGTSMLVGWAPGNEGALMDEDYAMRVTAGSQLIMQVHYNTAATGEADESRPDESQLALWLYPDDKTPKGLVTLYPLADVSIDIAAGDAESIQSSTQRIPVDATLVGVAPHMHLLGTQLKTVLEREDGTTECVADVPYWDFNWQRMYTFEEESALQVDIRDRFTLTCTYDNSDNNQPEDGDGEVFEPRDVQWGDGSHDEMCLNYLIFASPYYEGTSSGVCAGYRECRDDCEEDDAFCALACMAGTGEACLYCGVDGLFGDCMESACTTELMTFGACFYTCPDPYSDFFGCIYDTCPESFSDYFACANATLDEGTCDEEFAACGGLTP